jgi:hypothetical protein
MTSFSTTFNMAVTLFLTEGDNPFVLFEQGLCLKEFVAVVCVEMGLYVPS